MNHILRSQLLRKMRKEAKINQADLAEIIGICRETIINIEKSQEGAISSMSLTNMVKWFHACEARAEVKTKIAFINYVINLF